MVRSPWKIISGLMSRRKTVDQRPDTSIVNPDVEDGIEADVPPSDQSAHINAVDLGERSAAPAQIQPDHTDEGASEAMEASTEVSSRQPNQSEADRSAGMIADKAEVPALDRPPGSTAMRSNRAKRQPSEKAPSNSRKTDAAVKAARRQSPNDQVQALEVEIARLRTELATKLRQQNDQLRGMLKRFEPR